MTHWMCIKCGYLFSAPSPPNECPGCKEVCVFNDVTCYRPECGGEQQMTSLGRGLMSNPRLLCVDEPTVGLAPKLKEVLGERLKQIQESGIPVLLVEQDVSLAFGLTSRNYILSQGERSP